MKGKKISIAFMPFSLTSPSSLLKLPIDYGLKTANRCILPVSMLILYISEFTVIRTDFSAVFFIGNNFRGHLISRK